MGGAVVRWWMAAAAAVVGVAAADDGKWPTVAVGVAVRNKAHTLPFTLTLLAALDYPKSRMALWISTDNNHDNSVDVLKLWLERNSANYHSVYLNASGSTGDLNDENGTVWSPERFNHIISLRQRALDYGRSIWADFLFMVDADVFLTDPQVLKTLVLKNYTLVSPMVNSDGLYSNFWGQMGENYYYERADNYYDIVRRNNISCFDVPMVHSAVLIDLRKAISDQLTYDPRNIDDYDGPYDDIIVFAISAKRAGVQMMICNDRIYGYLTIPLEKNYSVDSDHTQLKNLRVESVYGDRRIYADAMFEKFVPPVRPDNMNFDSVYMINLKRRTDRREKMEESTGELGIDVEWIDAVDGKDLNEEKLVEWGIHLMENYRDPYSDRPMKMGEIGCFLSHYIVWNKTVSEKKNQVMILEDDVHFQPYFHQKVDALMKQIVSNKIDWDLIYLGRKKIADVDEKAILPMLLEAEYSYWTLGYLLSYSGAKKLLDSKPLSNLLPVDEFLPILSNKHPEESWSSQFAKRNLKVFSIHPLVIYPTHYTGEDGYISDTEDSLKITNVRVSFKEDL